MSDRHALGRKLTSIINILYKYIDYKIAASVV